MATQAELLERYKPQLIYDSQESYFSDSAAEWTDAPGNVLQRSNGKTALAAATPEGDEAQLSLDFLAKRRYPTGRPVRKADRISHPKKDYLEHYRLLHPQARYRNRVYGHAVRGTDRLWLQYWFFYYYNDAPLKWTNYGKHEGDWEMIQLRLGSDGRPDLAVYAQHQVAGVRQWQDVRKTGDAPLVWVARGAHASYFQPGHHWNDRADGGRPGRPLTLEVVHHELPGWIAWPGVWGDTHAESASQGQSSPGGPCVHTQWRKPDSLIPKAAAVRVVPLLAPPPHPELIEAARVEDRAEVHYAFPQGTSVSGMKLLVTVNSPDDEFPPATYRLPIKKPAGTVKAKLPLVETRGYEITVSAMGKGGALSSAVPRTLPPAFGPIGPIEPGP